jgi:hypothetical protein
MMLEVLNKLLADKELMKEPVAFATVSALKKFVEDGGKLSMLSWFKGLNFELWEREEEEAA